ncbi:MAG: hypothetical protein KAF91_03370 [Nostoc sp. TH1S01]|nr:hypothetical protein [Nostoc sp. TH1S01]
MDKQQSPQDTISQIITRLVNLPDKIAGAVREGLKEPSNLVCIQEGVFNFELIEEDVRRIQGDMKARGDKVLGSNLILYKERKLIEIQTYTERDDKTFVITVDAEIKRGTNIPPDILDELNEQGSVVLNLKLT